MDDRGNMIREGNQNAIYKRQKECRKKEKGMKLHIEMNSK